MQKNQFYNKVLAYEKANCLVADGGDMRRGMRRESERRAKAYVHESDSEKQAQKQVFGRMRICVVWRGYRNWWETQG